MKTHQFLVTLESPNGTSAEQAKEALLDAVQLGRSRMASATKDEVAIRYLKTQIKSIKHESSTT